MKQQLVLLRTENDLLNSLIGQSFNQRTKFEAEKILTEIHSKAQDRSIGKMVLCYVHDKGEIKGVGGSTLLKDKKTGEIKSNLILNNFGIFLAGLFKGDNLAKSVTLQDQSNVARIINIYAGGNFFNAILVGGMDLRIGSGSTPPAGTNFNVETPFGTAPENINFASSNPVFNLGLRNFKYAGAITAGGSGTINESVTRAVWDDNGNVSRGWTLFRDIISPSVSFIIGQTIALEYTVQL